MIAYPETLKELLGVKVDVVSRRGIKLRIRERALQEAIPYERPKEQPQKLEEHNPLKP
jgi:hypothetical protein